MSDSNDFGNFFAGFIMGGLVGAAVALLLAPQSGEETRAIIKDKSIELKDKAVEYSQDAKVRAEQAMLDARTKVGAAIDDLRVRTDEYPRDERAHRGNPTNRTGGARRAESPS